MHILPVLGATRVDRLTTEQIERWHAGLVADADPEARRRSQDSANRVLAILKAALNGAFKDAANGIESDAAWRRVKPFRAVGAPREDHFDPAQVRTLIAKAATFDPRFAELCEAGYLVGARLAELTGRDVRDFDAERGTLTIRTGKTGARVVTLTSEAVAFFKRLTNGKLPGAVLLPRADGARWQANQQTPRFARALRLAELPLTASFYALRHSWISRAIESGMPLSLVAEQAGTSLRMLESNYAKVLAATRRDVIERTAPKLRRVK